MLFSYYITLCSNSWAMYTEYKKTRTGEEGQTNQHHQSSSTPTIFNKVILGPNYRHKSDLKYTAIS